MRFIIFTLLILYLTINDTIAQVSAKAVDISPLLISEKIRMLASRLLKANQSH